jgi:hypothetical protein
MQDKSLFTVKPVPTRPKTKYDRVLTDKRTGKPSKAPVRASNARF